jgi:chromosome segregation ATPase
VAGEAALYVDPFNPDELGIALEAVQEPNAREDLRNRGLAQVQRFSWTKMAEGIAETITRIAKDMNYNSLKQQDWIWSEFRKSQRERSTLQQQNQSLQEHNQSLQEHYQSLQKDNQSLQKDNQSLQKDNQSLQETYQSLLQYHHSVEETYQSLLQQHESLQQQHESLQQQHESLQQQNQLLHQHIAAMESSKFWKIRTSWVRLKELVGSATTDEVSR